MQRIKTKMRVLFVAAALSLGVSGYLALNLASEQGMLSLILMGAALGAVGVGFLWLASGVFSRGAIVESGSLSKEGPESTLSPEERNLQELAIRLDDLSTRARLLSKSFPRGRTAKKESQRVFAISDTVRSLTHESLYLTHQILELLNQQAKTFGNREPAPEWRGLLNQISEQTNLLEKIAQNLAQTAESIPETPSETSAPARPPRKGRPSRRKPA